MIWQSQPALASCWKQMYFGLEQAPLQQAGDGHGSIFCKGLCSWQSSLCHRTLPCAPLACVPVRLQCFEARGGEEELHEEEEVEGWRAYSLLPPHLPLHKTPLPRRVKRHFINTITKLLGSIPRGRWIAQQKQID